MNNIETLIVYEDEYLILCHKPPGVLSQADRGFAEDMVSALMTYEKKKGNQRPFIAPVNRLDRPVEGLVLFAKSSKTAALLTKQITEGETDKRYYAVAQPGESVRRFLCGEVSEGPEGAWITLTDYLLKDAQTNTSKAADSQTRGAKRAELEYRLLEMKGEGEKALLEVKLHTGRHHQIRVQLANAGLPLLGDTKYNPALAGAAGWHELALCSYHMAFDHPKKGRMEYDIRPESQAFWEFQHFFKAKG